MKLAVFLRSKCIAAGRICQPAIGNAASGPIGGRGGGGFGDLCAGVGGGGLLELTQAEKTLNGHTNELKPSNLKKDDREHSASVV